MSNYQFTLFSTLGCHLCEVAQALLIRSPHIDEAAIGVCDIASDDELIEVYGEKIPVLQHNDSGRELHWPFDDDTLELFIAGLDK